MRLFLKLGFVLWIPIGLSVSVADAATLRAGVAKVDITPPLGLRMWGYESRTTPAQGVLDPLYARVLALEAGPTRLVLVTLDLGRCFRPASIERLRGLVRNSSKVNYVLVAASHTHAAPDVEADDPSSTEKTWEESVIAKIAQAIDDAFQRAAEARIGTGYGVTYIGHNRLRPNADGSITWFERDTTKIPTAPVNPTVSVLRVDAADGNPLAILVNYACHAVVFGPDNLQYSSDFPGVMTKTVEAAFGGKPLCFFLQGAPGDINPYYAVTRLEQDAVRMRDWTGQHLGEEAARVAKAIQTEAATSASLDFAEDLLTFRPRWDMQKYRQVAKDSATHIQQAMQLPVSVVLINKRIALMGMPGEPFVDFQTNWRDRCPVPDALFLGYANGYFGYFPTIKAATQGGYGAASSATWVEVGAGERMVDHAVIKTYEMLGRFRDLPEDLAKDD